MEAFYDHRPPKIEAIGDGSWFYRWDITEYERPGIRETDGPVTEWKCNEVIIWPPVTSNTITAKVISELWDMNYEQKLINEYNMAILGEYEPEKAEEKTRRYKEFLKERETIKQMIDTDCAELGII